MGFYVVIIVVLIDQWFTEIGSQTLQSVVTFGSV